jgi:hypothetical protein
MILVSFLYMDEQWMKSMESVPCVGDRVTFGPVLTQNLQDEVEYEVTVVHWFENRFKTPQMIPYVSLRRVSEATADWRDHEQESRGPE